MSNIVIKVENLSKQYHLGQVGTGTMMHDMNRWWHKVRGKEDPYLKIGEVNDRSTKGTSDYVWSLRDINFEVKQGEVLGIIGKNGAGKSTLLKILSRVTNPTTGSVKVKGRIASLLEVGTGFHPELTGRENIFLNGAILGMSKQEIRSKFDEMVDFSGVERYIDTPVKRYSSGMYVRLAFAVAAHLEPEILIVDEVLAVGDAEFQKKCLGKMKDVSGQGRTVLFVSHQLGMINSLCGTAMLLQTGSIVKEGKAVDVVEYYLNANDSLNSGLPVREYKFVQGLPLQILKVTLRNRNNETKTEFDVFEEVLVDVEYEIREEFSGVSVCLALKKDDQIVYNTYDTDLDSSLLNKRNNGKYKTTLKLISPIKEGTYHLNISTGINNIGTIENLESALVFSSQNNSYDPTFVSYSRPAIVIAPIKWETKKI